MGRFRWIICLTVLLGLISVPAAFAEEEPLWPETWWPSKWGADDQKGAFNTITPEKVKQAMGLVEKARFTGSGWCTNPRCRCSASGPFP